MLGHRILPQGVIGNSVVAVLGICYILDTLLARLAVDEASVEVRTLTGAQILYRKSDPEARANTGAEISISPLFQPTPAMPETHTFCWATEMELLRFPATTIGITAP